ncbi:hypothetical protein ANN_04189 [Periplaneta americana]|uniref:Uncharacterized protein n=1 Tax=Periplaneta americana TaxID=6978 RepID=A0ABQ8T7W2_PERAM|nr:hypothetical protein ANN_04189 [Periplaneta americana]
MAGLCEGGNEPPSSLKAIFPTFRETLHGAARHTGWEPLISKCVMACCMSSFDLAVPMSLEMINLPTLPRKTYYLNAREVALASTAFILKSTLLIDTYGNVSSGKNVNCLETRTEGNIFEYDLVLAKNYCCEIRIEVDITTPPKTPQTPSAQGHLGLPNSSSTDTSFEELSPVPLIALKSGVKRVRKRQDSD